MLVQHERIVREACAFVGGDGAGTRVHRHVLGAVPSGQTYQLVHQLTPDSGIAKLRCNEHGLDVS